MGADQFLRMNTEQGLSQEVHLAHSVMLHFAEKYINSYSRILKKCVLALRYLSSVPSSSDERTRSAGKILVKRYDVH